MNRAVLRRRLRARSRQMKACKATEAAALAQAGQASFLLCAILAQCGGSKTLTKGTLDQCMREHDRMGFSMKDITGEGKEFEVTLLFKDDGKEMPDLPEEEAPACQTCGMEQANPQHLATCPDTAGAHTYRPFAPTGAGTPPISIAPIVITG